MKTNSPFAWIAIALISIGALYGLTTIGQHYYQTYAPRQEAIERQVYEQTPSYINGKNQTIAKLLGQYRATKIGSVERTAIRESIDNELTTVDTSLLSTEVRRGIAAL